MRIMSRDLKQKYLDRAEKLAGDLGFEVLPESVKMDIYNMAVEAVDAEDKELAIQENLAAEAESNQAAMAEAEWNYYEDLCRR